MTTRGVATGAALLALALMATASVEASSAWVLWRSTEVSSSQKKRGCPGPC